MSKRVFISGISTDVGKTVVSAIVARALNADYWKPIQSGDLDNSDSIKVQRWIGEGKILKEAYRLNQPMSPHASAAIDKVEIRLPISLPNSNNHLVVEGAGGLMVPLNQKGDMVIDLMKGLNLPTILVSRHYLGSINHTLLSIEALKARNIEIAGIIYVGDEHTSTEEIIESCHHLPVLGRVPWTENLSQDFIDQQADRLKKNIETCLPG